MYSKDQAKVLQAVLSKFGPLILDFKTGRQRRIMNTHELGLGGELRSTRSDFTLRSLPSPPAPG